MSEEQAALKDEVVELLQKENAQLKVERYNYWVKMQAARIDLASAKIAQQAAINAIEISSQATISSLLSAAIALYRGYPADHREAAVRVFMNVLTQAGIPLTDEFTEAILAEPPSK